MPKSRVRKKNIGKKDNPSPPKPRMKKLTDNSLLEKIKEEGLLNDGKDVTLVKNADEKMSEVLLDFVDPFSMH